MGTIVHHALVVTFLDYDNWGKQAREVHAWARNAKLRNEDSGEPDQLLVSDLFSGLNDSCSFAVLPDGSKEGWRTSENCNQLREELKRRLSEIVCVDWVEVQFGNCDFSEGVIDSSRGKDT